ncbi:MAG TPA: hypothetical protein VF164_05965, partial [Trueperaceae bacterium]
MATRDLIAQQALGGALPGPVDPDVAPYPDRIDEPDGRPERATAAQPQRVAYLLPDQRGHPTKGLYPFQWNWDSCLTALGQSHYDEERAWNEIATLFAHQWENGM